MTDQWWRATRQRRRIKVEVMQRCTRLMRKGHIPKRGCTKQSVTKCRRSDTHHIQQWIYINIRWKCVFSQQSNGPWSGLRNAFGGFVTSGNHTVATTVGKAWTVSWRHEVSLSDHMNHKTSTAMCWVSSWSFGQLARQNETKTKHPTGLLMNTLTHKSLIKGNSCHLVIMAIIARQLYSSTTTEKHDLGGEFQGVKCLTKKN